MTHTAIRKPTAEQLGTRLRNLRINRHLTQQGLADTLHVSVPTISKIEHGHQYPPVDLIIDYANVFHLTIDDILTIPVGIPSAATLPHALKHTPR